MRPQQLGVVNKERLTKLQPFSNGTAKKWLAGPQER